MTQCTSPLQGYRGLDGAFVSSAKNGFKDQPLTIRCGWCMGCRLHRAKSWAIRCTHEATLHENNIFCTLQYDEENLPYGNTLKRTDIQKFIKRLRRKTPKIRTFYCGEYGGETDRAHYHALLFGWEPSDKILVAEKDDQKTYTSEILSQTWGHGFANFSSVTYASAAYVASYTTSKILGLSAKEHYQWIDEDTGEIIDRTPPFSGQSRRPGIGEPFLKKWLRDIYPADTIIIGGKPMQPPAYYDDQLKKLDLKLYREVKANRSKKYQRELQQTKDANGIITKHGYMDAHLENYYGSDRQMLCNKAISLSKQRLRKETDS